MSLVEIIQKREKQEQQIYELAEEIEFLKKVLANAIKSRDKAIKKYKKIRKGLKWT